MFEIELDVDSATVRMRGRFDAAQSVRAQEVFSRLANSAIVDFGDVEYISSAGLGILFAAQKRLMDAGESLELVNLNPHIREVFEIAGFDSIFEIGDTRK
jgi:anti-anti-sigma factor